MRRRQRARDLEPAPSWVTEFTEGDWEDDLADLPWVLGVELPPERVAEIFRWHRESRWVKARNVWFADHPAHAEAEFQRLVGLAEDVP